MKRILLLATLASLVSAAALGIIILLVGDFGATQLKLLLTTLAIGGFSLVGSISASSSGIRLLPLRCLGIVACGAALAAVALQIWELMEFDDQGWKVLVVATVVAVTAAHLSLLAAFRTPNNFSRVWRGATALAAVLLAALIIVAVLERLDTGLRGIYLRLLGTVAILDVLGTVSLVPLSRLASPGRAARARSTRAKVARGSRREKAAASRSKNRRAPSRRQTVRRR